jgi:outer membrane protein assembly factor BamB
MARAGLRGKASVYSPWFRMRALSRSLLCLFLGSAVAGCHHAPTIAPRSLFPMSTVWTRPLPATVEGPLASDPLSVYVATRDGAVRGLEATTGRVRWRVDGRAGLVGAGGGLVTVRQEDGTVYAMDAATGADRWKAASGVRGTLPPVLYKDAVVIAGEGLAVLEAATGQARWTSAEVRATSLPLGSGPWLLVGEADGALRCRDIVTGTVLWSYKTTHPPAAPPVVDDDGRVLLGTTDRTFVALDARKKGDERWKWRIGGDVQAPPAVAGSLVLFANHEDVLYALRRRNGHLAWRAALPSRPLSGPLLYGDGVLVTCFGNRPGETFLIGFDPRTGRRQGDLKAPGELRTPPVIVGDLVVMALRERAVTALALGAVLPNP